jgi:hypothetical protein
VEGKDYHIYLHKQLFMLTYEQQGSINNRPLDPRHVRLLEGSMKTSIRRTEPADRLRVSMSKANFEASLVYTVQELEREAESNPDVPKYTVESLRTAIQNAFHHRGGPISAFPPLFWCGGDDRPQLDAGQHRRAAFMNVVDPEQKTTQLTAANIKVMLLFRIDQCDRRAR